MEAARNWLRNVRTISLNNLGQETPPSPTQQNINNLGDELNLGQETPPSPTVSEKSRKALNKALLVIRAAQAFRKEGILQKKKKAAQAKKQNNLGKPKRFGLRKQFQTALSPASSTNEL